MAHKLSNADKQQLIEQLKNDLQETEPIKPVALVGRWEGKVKSLSFEEIKQARRECWKGLGNDD